MGVQTENTSVNFPGRKLSLREQFHLQMFGNPDQDDVNKLLESKDHHAGSVIPFVHSGYHSSEVWDLINAAKKESYFANGARNNTISNQGILGIVETNPNIPAKLPTSQVTSTALLDHLLDKADPETRKKLVHEGIQGAADTPDYSALEHPDFAYITKGASVQDITGKLYVFSKHGGDINEAVLTAKDPQNILRDAKIVLGAGQTLSSESHQYILDNITKINKLLYEHPTQEIGTAALMMSALVAGAVPKHNISVSTFHADEKAISPIHRLSSKDPLALILAYDPSSQNFDTLLAKSSKINEAELFYAAALGADPMTAFKKLKDYGMDINAKDPVTGCTALTRLVAETEMGDHIVESNYLPLVKEMKALGADTKVTDKTGKTAENYFDAKLSTLARKQEKEISEQTGVLEKIKARTLSNMTLN